MMMIRNINIIKEAGSDGWSEGNRKAQLLKGFQNCGNKNHSMNFGNHLCTTPYK